MEQIPSQYRVNLLLFGAVSFLAPCRFWRRVVFGVRAAQGRLFGRTFFF